MGAFRRRRLWRGPKAIPVGTKLTGTTAVPRIGAVRTPSRNGGFDVAMCQICPASRNIIAHDQAMTGPSMRRVNFNDAYKEWRNRARCYSRESIIVSAINVLSEPSSDPETELGKLLGSLCSWSSGSVRTGIAIAGARNRFLAVNWTICTSDLGISPSGWCDANATTYLVDCS